MMMVVSWEHQARVGWMQLLKDTKGGICELAASATL